MSTRLLRPALRVLFPAIGLGSLFLPWVTLDISGSMSGFEIMKYVLTGGVLQSLFREALFLRPDIMALLILPFVIVVISQVVLWGIKPFRMAMVAFVAMMLMLWLVTPISDDRTQIVAFPGIGLILLAITMMISVALQVFMPKAGLSPRPRISKRVKNALYNECGGRCALCGDKHHIGNLDVDHIRARARRGADSYDNYQLLCGRCNRLKGTRTMSEARARLAEVGR